MAKIHWAPKQNEFSPHRVVANFVYDLPFGKGKQWLTSGPASYVLGNWRVSGLYTFASGRPYTVTLGAPYSTNLDQFGANTAVPNVIGAPLTIGNVDCWFYLSTNKACQGYSGRTVERVCESCARHARQRGTQYPTWTAHECLRCIVDEELSDRRTLEHAAPLGSVQCWQSGALRPAK
jgi:hypothetical protein